MALRDELPLIPQMLDHLEVDHHVELGVGQRQLGQIALSHVDPGVAGPNVGYRRLVVVQPDDPARDVGDQVGAVALAGAGLEHVTPRTAVGQPLVDHLVAAEPVVLLRQAGDRAFPGQGHHGVG